MHSDQRLVGEMVPYRGADRPNLRPLQGRFVHLEALEPARHGPVLWSQMAGQAELWDYLSEAPPATEVAFISVLENACATEGWEGYAICLPNDLGDDMGDDTGGGGAVGYAFYLNIVPQMGSVEVGNINFSPALQRTPAATEAMYLMMREAFELGYRRYEWKCNALNMPSRRAAQRLGFSWEGIFRQHMVVKSRNRDTAWLAMTDQDWPALKPAFESWLSPENFDGAGRQRTRLSDLTSPIRVSSDPKQT